MAGLAFVASAILGAGRYIACEAAAPLEEIERLARAPHSPAPAPEDAAEFDDPVIAAPTVPEFQPLDSVPVESPAGNVADSAGERLQLRAESFYRLAKQRLTVQFAQYSLDEFVPSHRGSFHAISDLADLPDYVKERIAAWGEWRQKAIEGLSEPYRNDENHLKQIDTTYQEMVNLELSAYRPPSAVRGTALQEYARSAIYAAAENSRGDFRVIK